MRTSTYQSFIYFFTTLIVISVCVSFLVPALSAEAQFNQEINYQGKLTNAAGVAVPDGLYNMNFWLVGSSTAATSTAVWTETRISGDRVQVTNGLFSVMLGEVATLTSVDFNQTLYLGVEIGGIATTTPTWDGEMSPRKVLGAVPAAFVAETAASADTLSGIASSSFLRSDEIDTMEASSTSPLLSLIQNGAGKVASFFSGVTEVFTILSNGNVGVGTSTPSTDFTVAGDALVTGQSTLATTTISSLNLGTALTAVNGGTGLSSITQNQLLIGGAGNTWAQVATSSLGLGNNTFLGLTDTISSYNANRIMFTNSGATALTDSTDFTYDGINLGLGGSNGIAFNSTRYITASTTNDSITFGENAGATFTNNTTNNVALGFEAGRYASTTAADNNNYIGYQAGQSNTGANNNLFGSLAGQNNTGTQNNFFGTTAGQSNTGSYNNFFGFLAGLENTGSYNNFFGSAAGYINTGSYNEMLGFETGRYIQSTSSVLIGSGAFHGVGNFLAINNTAIGYQAGYAAQTGSDNNILLGYRAADNLTTGNNNIVIGYDVDLTTATTDNTLNIGNLIFGTALDGTGTTLASGNIGIGTTTPGSKLTVAGNISSTGIILSATGTAAAPAYSFTSDSNTGIFNQAADILGFTAAGIERVRFSTTNLDLRGTGIAFDGTRYITASTTNDSITFGENAGATFTNNTTNNVALGFEAGRYASTSLADNNNYIGYQAGGNNTGSYNNLFGYTAGSFNTGSNNNLLGQLSGVLNTGQHNNIFGYWAGFSNSGQNNNIFGESAGNNNTGSYNNLLGYRAGYNNTGSTNNIFGLDTGFSNTGSNNNFLGSYAGYNNTGSYNEMLGFETGRYIQSTSSVLLGSGAFHGTGIFQAINNTAIGYQAGYNATTTADNNILLGYRAADNLTTGNNNIVIGYDVDLTTATTDNTLNIGNLIFGTALDGTGTTLSSGNIGIGTTTPGSKLTVAGSTYIGGNLTATGISTFTNASTTNLSISGTLHDSVSSAGTTGMVLQTTGTGTQWVATSTLGITGGASTFLSLTDTISSFNANRIMYTNSAATALIDSADFTYDGTDLGLGATNGIAFGGTRYIYASSTNDSITFGENAGATFTANTINNVALGFEAGRYASTSLADNNNYIGYIAGQNNTGAQNNLFGYQAGLSNTGSNNNLLGSSAGINNTGSTNNILGESAGSGNTGSYNNLLGLWAGFSNTGSYNNIFGRQAGYSNTGSYNNFFGQYAGQNNIDSYNNFFGQYAGQNNTGSYNEMFGFETGRFSQSTSSVLVGSGAFRGASNFQAINNVALGYQAGYAAQTGSNNNILLGYRAADNLTTGNNNIVIGYDIDLTTATTDNTLNIGNLIFGTGLDGTGTTLASGKVGIGTSSPSLRLDVAAPKGLPATSGTTQTGIFRTRASDGTGVMDQGQVSGGGSWMQATDANNLALNYSLLLNPNGGNVGIGDTAPVSKLSVGSSTAALEAIGGINEAVTVSSGGSAGAVLLAAENRATSSSSGGAFSALYANDGAAMASGDRLGGFLIGGYNGTTLQNSALIDAYATEAWSGSAAGSAIAFQTTANGGTTRSEKMRILGSGLVGIGTTTPGSILTTSAATGVLANLTSNASGVNFFTGTYNGLQQYRTGFGGAGEVQFTVTDSVDNANGNYFINKSGESFGRAVFGRGFLAFGPGSATRDTYINRSATSTFLISSDQSTGAANLIVTGKIGIGTTTPIAKLEVTAGTLTDQTNGIRVTGTMPSSATTFNSLVNVRATSANNSQNNYAFNMDYLAGATDTLLHSAGRFANAAAGTGAGTFTTGSYAGAGNKGVIATASGVTAGHNIGVAGLASGSTVFNAGGFFEVTSNAGVGLAAGNRTSTADIFRAYDNTTQVFSIIDGGNVGIGTTTPDSKLTIVGDSYITGAFRDTTNASGTLGMILQTTGTSTRWVATSTLGITGGASTFLGLTDTISSYNANRIMFTNSGATALTDSTDFTYDGINLGLGGSNGIAFNSTRYITASTTNDSITFGENAGATFTNNTTNNVALGFEAGRYASTTAADNNNYIGYQAGLSNVGGNNNLFGYTVGSENTGSNNNIFGTGAGFFNTGSNNNILGLDAGGENTGSSNNLFGASAGISNTGSYNNFFGESAGTNNTGSYNEMLGFETGLNVQSTSSVLLGSGAFHGTGIFQAINNTAIGYQAGYAAQTGSDNNILLGYRAADNLTTGNNNIVIGYDVDLTTATTDNTLNIGNLIFGTALDGTGTTLSSGNIGIGTTTPVARLSLERRNFNTASGVAGMDQYFSFNNSVADTTLYGNRTYLYATNTATTTIIGSIVRVSDSTTYGNTVRGLEVQADNGNNTQGENTGIAAFGRTFGVRGTTVGDAGGRFEPAGIYGETEGTTQGNAIRGYSASITTAALLKLFQDTSTFTGTGLLMNFGNAGGSFSSTTASRFVDFQNAGTSMFAVGAYGMTTIGDGTTSHNAGLQIGYGGLCVDNDGSCTASTTGRVSAVSYHTGNSDLAETYFSDESLKTGDVVYLKGGLSVGKATTDTKDKVIGVVSTKPGLLLGFDDSSLEEDEASYPIGLAGRVPVRLSTENGEIKAGDELMLSSLPGVAMKATSTGTVIGIALEDFDANRAYSDTFINQFGDDLVEPNFTPINRTSDPRINDGCYYGAGNASGEEVCVPLTATTTDGQVVEAEALALAEAEQVALAALKNVNSEGRMVNGTEVQVGQIVMFIKLEENRLSEEGEVMVAALLAQASGADTNLAAADTVWARLVSLANNFIDGVLSVFTLKADRVEVKEELCVDGVCLNADDLRQLLDSTTTPAVEENPELEPEIAPEVVSGEEGGTGEQIGDGGVSETDGSEPVPAEPTGEEVTSVPVPTTENVEGAAEEGVSPGIDITGEVPAEEEAVSEPAVEVPEEPTPVLELTEPAV